MKLLLYFQLQHKCSFILRPQNQPEKCGLELRGLLMEHNISFTRENWLLDSWFIIETWSFYSLILKWKQKSFPNFWRAAIFNLLSSSASYLLAAIFNQPMGQHSSCGPTGSHDEWHQPTHIPLMMAARCSPKIWEQFCFHLRLIE